MLGNVNDKSANPSKTIQDQGKTEGRGFDSWIQQPDKPSGLLSVSIQKRCLHKSDNQNSKETKLGY